MREERNRMTGRNRATARAKRGAAKVAQTAEDYAEDARSRAQAAYDHAAEWASDAYERGARGYQRARETSGEAFHMASDRMQALVAERPYVVGLAGLAAGIVIGALVSHTCSSARQDDWDEDED